MSTPLVFSEAPRAHVASDFKASEEGVVQITQHAPVELSSISSPSTSSTSGKDLVIANGEDTPEPGPPSVEAQVLQVLQIIQTYGVAFERTSRWEGLASFIPKVKKQIEACEPVRLLLPGFPYKSPNAKDKVLGALPDLGEELALAHLNGLCDNIATVYEHGAEVHILSDGLVYNDLLGVPDEAVWTYGEAVRAIAHEKNLPHLRFIRLWELFEHTGVWDKAHYLTHAPCIRRELIYRYGDSEFDPEMAAKTNEDVRITLASYEKFLRKDLAYDLRYAALTEDERAVKFQEIAKQMMLRWRAYGAAMEANKSELVRLSIHDSAGKGKLSMALVPQQEKGVIGHTPWHSAVVVELDGSYRTVHAAEVGAEYELVLKDGRPFCYRAKSKLFDWTDSGLDVTFEHLYPCGLIIRPVVPKGSSAPSMEAIPGKKVRDLSNNFSPVVMRGFAGTKSEANYRSKADDLGKVLSWTFGEIFKVVDTREVEKKANNVTSNEAMPMHFDGCFKFVEHTDPKTGETKKVLAPPGYQYFTCISTAPEGTGYTLFANSRLFFRHLSQPWTVERMEPVTWQMENDGFWSNKQTGLPLVKRHPVTEKPCIRWHQPWTETKFSRYRVTIENDEQALVDVVNKLVYDYRVCLRFTWNEGDLLVNDNVSMLHTQTPYASKCDREMWRIHFD